MATKIQLKRGLSNNFSSVNLSAGEPAFVTNSGKLYIGNGTDKILVNPIDKPGGIDTTNLFTKVKVNEYGQVTSQSNLIASDIPTIPSTKVSGLGTAATVNTGTSSGNIPVLDSSGKLLSSVLPTSSVPYAIATFSGSDATIVTSNKYVPLSNLTTSHTNIFTIDSNGIISVSIPGIYLVSYNVTSTSTTMTVSLGNGGLSGYTGTYVRTSSTSVPSTVCASVTTVRPVTIVPEKYGILNSGTTNMSLLSNFASISIVKLA